MCSGREYTVQVVGAWVLLEGIVPFTRDFQPLRLLRTGPFGGAGHRLAHCQVMPSGLSELSLPDPAAWTSEPGCRPWPPSALPDQSGPVPGNGSAGTRPPSSSSQISPQPVYEQRSRRALLRLKTNRLSHTQPAPFPLAYDPAPHRNRPR